jgi:N-acetylglucosaminyl-diphospho-decaprenol L-rhamnosyltransferase
MSNISVAVVIVTYKSADLTIDCLRSIQGERLTSQLHISAVIIDNSAEDYPIVLQAIEENKWSDWVELARTPKNGGFAYGNNFGVRLASRAGLPDYVHLLNPDTIVRKGAIDTLVGFLKSHCEVGIAGSGFENLDGSDWPIAFRFPTLFSEIEQGLQLGLVTRVLRSWVVARTMSTEPERVDWVPGASMMIRKHVFDALGGLDENYFLYFEETDFCARAAKLGFETWYVPQSRVMHIAGQSTKVTERNAASKRLPSYWFESRRRYFLVTYGLRYAVLTDIVAVFAHCVGFFKRFTFRQVDRGIPHFISDLIRYSVLWPKNRKFEQRPSGFVL